jgi:peptidoglycan/xylan/chitin deacetylase (PgdA/CDA1 family)
VISGAGHEIGVHGLAHSDDYAALEPAEAVRRLAEARAILEDVAGAPLSGVRTPRLRPCAAAVLERAGFRYDASPHPTWIPGRYNGLGLPRAPWHEGALLRIPISVLPWLRLPVSWLWYRSAGSPLADLALRAAAAGAPYLHLYFHPWEAVPLRPLRVPPLLALRSGDAFVASLDRTLERLLPAFPASTLAHFAESFDEVPRSAHPDLPRKRGRV